MSRDASSSSPTFCAWRGTFSVPTEVNFLRGGKYRILRISVAPLRKHQTLGLQKVRGSQHLNNKADERIVVSFSLGVGGNPEWQRNEIL
jgi:hypothetical protein